MSEKHKRTVAERAKNAERRQSLRSIEEQFGAPPPYSSQAPSVAASSSNSGAAQIPITPFENLDFKASPLELPTVAECITHLKLLHAFAKLRHEVGNHEGLFGIEFEVFEDTKEKVASHNEEVPANDAQEPQGIHEQDPSATVAEVHAPTDQEAALAERLREKRWTVFVTRAVDRFEKWWSSLPRTSSLLPSPIQTQDFDSATNNSLPQLFLHTGKGMDEQMTYSLPPLDILMVWHTYMLNPRVYLEDCMRASKHTLWRTLFPWKLIYDAVDGENFDYNPPAACQDTVSKSTSIVWDWRDDHSLKAISCPKCSCHITIPYTRPPTTSNPETIEVYLSVDTGYAGQAFEEPCPQCSLIITHEKMRVSKFIADANALWIYNRPLPGTILNSRGMPELTGKNKMIGTHDPFFPNRVIQKLDDFKPPALRETIDRLDMPTIKRRFHNVMASSSTLRIVNSEQYKTDFLAKESKIAVRKMLSHYWDNASPFGLDLVGAVIRQGTFVQKMRKIDWLHSPSVVPTMHRLVVKYHRFIRIVADHPKKIAVPTLDVDLAWHTHQLSPKVYYKYTVAETKKFLNHDDKIPEGTLHEQFQWTATAYEKKYGQPYAECACWYCEATREPLRSSFSNRVNPFRSSVDVSQLSDRGMPRDAVLGPHVSAHNALVMEGASSAQQRRRELEELDLQYAKVCKRYQKKKRQDETPSRDNDAYIYGAYGYPMYYPVYVPYYAEPTCEDNRYSSSGGTGGCAAGTCSASASVGNCAGGSGTPGCKASCGGHGDASGGCGNCGGDGGGDGGCGGCGG